MLRSDLCDYFDAYVLVKGTITITDQNNNDNFDRRLTLKNNGPIISCISKINGELVENEEDLDIVIRMYNLLEYSKNYEKLQDLCLIITEMNQKIIMKVMVITQ